MMDGPAHIGKRRRGALVDFTERGSNKIQRGINRLRGLLLAPFLRECRGPLSIGSGLSILGRDCVTCLGPFRARNRNRIEAYVRHGGVHYRPSIVFGANVSMEDDCHIGAVNRVELHDNVMLASKVYISDHAHGSTELDDLLVPPHRRTVWSKGPVIIEADVWIGESVAVLPGVRIGRGSVIGANSVVTRDIPPYSIAAGVPARVLKSRNAPASFRSDGSATREHE